MCLFLVASGAGVPDGVGRGAGAAVAGRPAALAGALPAYEAREAHALAPAPPSCWAVAAAGWPADVAHSRRRSPEPCACTPAALGLLQHDACCVALAHVRALGCCAARRPESTRAMAQGAAAGASCGGHRPPTIARPNVLAALPPNREQVFQRTARDCPDTIFLGVDADSDGGAEVCDALGIDVLPTLQVGPRGCALGVSRPAAGPFRSACSCRLSRAA